MLKLMYFGDKMGIIFVVAVRTDKCFSCTFRGGWRFFFPYHWLNFTKVIVGKWTCQLGQASARNKASSFEWNHTLYDEGGGGGGCDKKPPYFHKTSPSPFHNQCQHPLIDHTITPPTLKPMLNNHSTRFPFMDFLSIFHAPPFLLQSHRNL